MSNKFAVLIKTTSGWEDCWFVDDEPMRFSSYQDAEEEIVDHILECESLSSEDRIDRSDFKIVACEPNGAVDFSKINDLDDDDDDNDQLDVYYFSEGPEQCRDCGARVNIVQEILPDIIDDDYYQIVQCPFCQYKYKLEDPEDE